MLPRRLNAEKQGHCQGPVAGLAGPAEFVPILAFFREVPMPGPIRLKPPLNRPHRGRFRAGRSIKDKDLSSTAKSPVELYFSSGSMIWDSRSSGIAPGCWAWPLTIRVGVKQIGRAHV